MVLFSKTVNIDILDNEKFLNILLNLTPLRSLPYLLRGSHWG